MALKKKKTTGKRTFKIKKGQRKSMKANSKNNNIVSYLLFGALFGYFLSKSRATDYDTVLNMFLFKDFQLYGVILVAIAAAALGFLMLRASKHPTRSGEKLDWKKMAFERKRLMGAFLFGAGWAIAGTCPGTSLTQLGEGKLVALFTVSGIFLGVWAYTQFMPEKTSEDEVC